MASNSKLTGRIWPEFELVQDFMFALVNCKCGEDPIKTEGAMVFTTFSPL